GHQALVGGTRETPERHHRYAQQKPTAGRRKAVDRESHRAEEQPDHQRAALSRPGDNPTNEPRLHHHGADAHRSKGQADSTLRPTIAKAGVEHEGTRQNDMRELAKEIDDRQAGEFAMRAEQAKGADRIGSAPPERRAALDRQALRQDEEAIGKIGKAEYAGKPEGQARAELAQQSADGRSEQEADTKGSAH